MKLYVLRNIYFFYSDVFYCARTGKTPPHSYSELGKYRKNFSHLDKKVNKKELLR